MYITLDNLNITQEADEDYDNFKSFDYEVSLMHPEKNPLVQEILAKVGGFHQKNFLHMAVIIANLMMVYSYGKKYLGYTKATRRIPSRSNHFGLYQGRIVGLMALLTENGFVNDHNGEWDWMNGRNFCSKTYATEEFMDLVRLHYPDGIEVVFHSEKATVILRDKVRRGEDKGKIIEYKMTKITDDMQSRMKRYNRLLEQNQITLDEDSADPVVVAATNYTKTFAFRVFNGGSFMQGGRGYGGWWLDVPNRRKKQKQRQHILINGEPTVEIDFCNQHLVLLYAAEGIHYGDNGVDGYKLPVHQLEDGMREATKSMFTKAVNCQSAPKTVKAFLFAYEEEKDDAEKKGELYQEFPQSVLDNPKLLLSELKKVHSPIARHLCKGKHVGLYLQYVDSLIADEILRVMTKKKIVVLSVHDSFICAIQHEGVLVQAITDAYFKIVRREFGLELDGVLRLSRKFQGDKRELEVEFGMAA